jgi:cytochrome b pre-mRNA-processing protein 3
MLKIRRPRDAGPARLYALAVESSRQPDLYAVMGAPDTVEGRFELLTVHIILFIERLNREGVAGKAIGQALFDLYLRNLDSALREMGVGDLAVGKRMKGLGKIFYGRAAAYVAAFETGDTAAVEALVARTVLVDRPGADPGPLANHFVKERRRLAGMGLDEIMLERQA